MIDTHCHLEMKAFDGDRDEVVRRAREAGLEAVITIGSDLAGCKGAVELAGRYGLVYATVGIHPHDASSFNDETFAQLRTWIKKPRVVAVGEIGLDYHYDHSPRDVQREVFAMQLSFARESDLPVVVHSREAKADTLRILEESGVNRGVMHCFSGDVDMAAKALSMGLHISIAGPITFRNASRLKEVARMVPDERLLVETDAPYLPPEPVRGKRNEPAYVVHVAQELADLRGVSPRDIDRITTLNARRLFGTGDLPAGEIAYQIRDNLYLNLTNRCTSCCTFCVRFHTDYVKGHNLRLLDEPTEEQFREAVGDPARFREVVFCGYGEPMLRLDLVKSLSSWVKQRGGRVRLNTNGHGNVINGRNVLPELQGLVDVVSVSLNAPDAETYDKVCRPSIKGAFESVVDFIREAKKYMPAVQVTVVEMEGVDIERCRKLADELGVELRVRHLDVVG
jgi:TatD DNase family protein